MAQTGTGKTAAFALPIAHKVDPDNHQVQAVVICPTRELAIQVAEEFRKLTKYKNGISVVCVYGGQPMERQLMALQNEPQIIIGTPGRLLDHLWRGSFHLNAVQTVVLDEADEMLDMGFRDDIERVLGFIPTPRQTVLFSATMPKAIMELTGLYLVDPITVKVQPKADEIALITQHYVEVSSKSKMKALTSILDQQQIKLALVFCNSKRQVDDLSARLRSCGYAVEGLHGGMTQSRRDSVMGRFRKGTLRILVATDVAARGIDVRNVEMVFNYDLPEEVERYIHRIGRTGRAGKTGQAVTLVSASQAPRLHMLQTTLKHPLIRQTLPGIESPFTGLTVQPAVGAAPGAPNPKKRRKRRRSGPNPELPLQTAQ